MATDGIVKTHLDLFSGIGGFALAASWAGYQTVQFCEIDPFARAVLNKNFPEVPIHDDIRTLTADVVGQPIDLLTGGWPCQPFSVAGKQRGADDDRHLWPEMARIIGEVRPRWVLGENVAGFIPMALDDCLADLEGIGYEAWAIVVPACAVGAWHRRDRVWIVAHASSERRQQIPRGAHGDEAADEGRATELSYLAERHGQGGGEGIAADAKCKRRDGQPDASPRNDTNGHDARWQEEARRIEQCDWWEFESRLRGVPDGLSIGVDGRAARLKALGNAIVPQVAYLIIRLMD